MEKLTFISFHGNLKSNSKFAIPDPNIIVNLIESRVSGCGLFFPLAFLRPLLIFLATRTREESLLLYAFAGDKYYECSLNDRPMLFNYPFEPAWSDGGVKWMLRASYPNLNAIWTRFSRRFQWTLQQKHARSSTFFRLASALRHRTGGGPLPPSTPFSSTSCPPLPVHPKNLWLFLES